MIFFPGWTGIWPASAPDTGAFKYLANASQWSSGLGWVTSVTGHFTTSATKASSCTGLILGSSYRPRGLPMQDLPVLLLKLNIKK